MESPICSIYNKELLNMTHCTYVCVFFLSRKIAFFFFHYCVASKPSSNDHFQKFSFFSIISRSCFRWFYRLWCFYSFLYLSISRNRMSMLGFHKKFACILECITQTGARKSCNLKNTNFSWQERVKNVSIVHIIQ